MEVVAHGVLSSEAVEIGRVAFLHVVEAQRCGTFTGGQGRGRVLGAEGRRLRDAVGTRADGDSPTRTAWSRNPRGARAWHVRGCNRAAATSGRSGAQGLPRRNRRQSCRRCQLERARGQRVYVADACVGRPGGQSGAAGDPGTGNSRRAGPFSDCCASVRLSPVT